MMDSTLVPKDDHGEDKEEEGVEILKIVGKVGLTSNKERLLESIKERWDRGDWIEI